MTEIEKLGVAQMYIEKLANGIDPLTDREVQENDIINNVRISRCLFYVADVLKRVQESGYAAQTKSKKKYAFVLGFEARKNFEYSETPITISEITRRINELIDQEKMKKLSYKNVVNWLVEIGLLIESVNSAGKKVRYPTYEGTTVGISVEQRVGDNGRYQVVVYNKDAQKFILDNLDSAIERNSVKRNP